MNSSLYYFRNYTSLDCNDPFLTDINLMGFNINEVYETIHSNVEVKFMREIMDSGILQAKYFLIE